MSVANMLRDALELGRRSSPILLEGDPLDPWADPDQPVTPAAVLVPVVERPHPGVILTVRTDTVRKHAGQVAFPGGRVDPEDEGPVAAALREAEEEIELPRGQVEVIGIADRYRTITGYEVTPVIGVVPPDLPLRPHPAEVAAIFEAPLDYLLNPRHQLIRTVEWRGVERSYYEIDWQGRRIWGATAAMIVNLSRRLALVS
jgi:8-oxo-dGTP pyrophosphatase MutT (NUDIX family)